MRIRRSSGALLPKYQTPGSAGMDLHAFLSQPVLLSPGERIKVPTGLFFEIPPGMAGFVWPRSGLALKQGLDTLAGLIDSDFRGELEVCLINLGQTDIVLEPGMRIAQIVFSPVAHLPIEESETLEETSRGGGGFGSTGI